MKEISAFESWYTKINKTEDEIEYLEFVWELMKTPYTDYHYSLIVRKETEDEFKDALWSRFDEHKDAETFLLDKLENDRDSENIGEILFALGKIVDLRQGKQKEKVCGYVREYINSANDAIRENAIIVLGWLGNSRDIALLGGLLLNDANPRCRAWSASAFMQMWFRRKSKTFLDKIAPYLYKSITQEKEAFVTGCVVNTVQNITGKKFGLTQKALDCVDAEKINSAKDRAITFLAKMSGE